MTVIGKPIRTTERTPINIPVPTKPQTPSEPVTAPQREPEKVPA